MTQMIQKCHTVTYLYFFLIIEITFLCKNIQKCILAKLNLEEQKCSYNYT